MYRILRNYSIASLACIILAAALLTIFYRHMTIQGIAHLGEKINVELAQTALHPVEPKLVDYLMSVAHIDRQGIEIHPINPQLEKTIQLIMTDTTVVRIKIYNQHGIVVFSTKSSQIGKDQHEKSSGDQHENKGFVSAINGKVASKLIYRDALNPYDNVTEEDNLIQTYLPVHRNRTAPIVGVFEIYTDINPLVEYAQYTQIAIAVGATVIMVLLYLALLIVVHRADKIIVTQQNTIRERTHTLEMLSAQLLTSQENEKKRIADNLHENVAQTLSAIKFQMEHACRLAGQRSTEENTKALEAIVATIQNAIQNVSALAMELRPPSLDELGIIATVDWYCRKFQSLHPEIHVELATDIEESKISHALKIIIYRIIQEALDSIARYSLANFVSLRLDRSENTVSLTLQYNGRLYQPGEASERNHAEKRIWVYTIEERAVLSGGTVSHDTKMSGESRIQFTWPAYNQG